ncbi:MAG: aldo/keto reductase [Wenzhouxiangella sp.]
MTVQVPSIATNGMNMPALGLGTWQLTAETLEAIIPVALDAGYRHFDTAQIYRNEQAVGQALESSGVDREELFLTTKVWVDHYAPDDLRSSVEQSLERLRCDYVDLLLLHWPAFAGNGMNDTLEALMRTRADGLARHIGISNFNIEQTEKAVAFCGQGTLAASQVEYHVYLAQERLRRVLAVSDLVLTAYMPLAKALCVNDQVLWDIGAQYGKSAPQVALRWLVEQDRVAAIPATSNPHHAKANIEIFDFALSADDREKIAQLARGQRLCQPEGLAPPWDD